MEKRFLFPEFVFVIWKKVAAKFGTKIFKKLIQKFGFKNKN